MSSWSRPLTVAAAGLLAVLGPGCRSELGECDQFAATQVVFLDTGNAANSINGIPMYAGQALMHSTCGSGQFCHTQAASSVERYGVPAGLYFDVQYACNPGRACDPARDEDEVGIARLSANQAVILDYARPILTSVRNGRMPPGGIGEQIVEEGGRFRVVEDAAFTTQNFTLHTQELPCGHPLTSCAEGESTQTVETQLLPKIGTREGNEILRNWLACGAPVVESTETKVMAAGLPCDGTGLTGHAGFCVNRIVLPPEPPDRSWTSIYTEVIEPLCGRSCHGSGTPNFVDESGLDLSSQQLAYDSIVNQLAKGEACAGVGTLVVPNDSAASLFIDKLTLEPICGDPMPSEFAVLPSEVVDVIRAWIDAGAPND